MKKIFYTVLFTFLAFTIPAKVLAGPTDIVNIPDATFKNYLIFTMNLDTNTDFELNEGELAAYSGALNISTKAISDITGIEYMTGLTSINAADNDITFIPTGISNLNSLTSLVLGGNKLTVLPVELFDITTLEILNVSANQLTTIPNEIGSLVNLEYFYAHENQITLLPDAIGNCTNITTLRMENNNLTAIPSTIDNLVNMANLSFFNNKITEIPSEVRNMTWLRYMILQNNEISVLPTWIDELVFLQGIDLDGNNITTIPSEVGNITTLEYLRLGNNNISTLPVNMFNATTLNELNLSNNNIVNVPTELSNLINMKDLNLSINKIETFPTEVTSMPLLEQLHLGYNNFSGWPEAVEGISTLRVLDLSGLGITTIAPDAFDLFTNIESIYLNDNQLTDAIVLPATFTSPIDIYLIFNNIETTDANLVALNGRSNIDVYYGLQRQEVVTNVSLTEKTDGIQIDIQDNINPTTVGDLLLMSYLEGNSFGLNTYDTYIDQIPTYNTMCTNYGILKDYETITRIYRIVDGGSRELINTSNDSSFNSYLDTTAPEGRVEYVVERFVNPIVHHPIYGVLAYIQGDYEKKSDWIDSKAQKGNIIGTILDSSGNPLNNYNVILHSSPITVVTDTNGEFKFENVSLTNHELIIENGSSVEIGRYNLNFTDGSSTSYAIVGNNVNLTVTSNVIAIEVILEESSDGNSVTIKEINFIENPQTGVEVNYSYISVIMLLIYGLVMYKVKRIEE